MKEAINTEDEKSFTHKLNETEQILIKMDVKRSPEIAQKYAMDSHKYIVMDSSQKYALDSQKIGMDSQKYVTYYRNIALDSSQKDAMDSKQYVMDSSQKYALDSK